MTKLFISTDLDGTLLDHHNYSHEPVDPVLARLQELGIPCVLNTSKTRAELIDLRQQLAHRDPFIVENGAAVYLPKSIPLNVVGQLPEQGGFCFHRFGPAREELLNVLAPLAERYRFTGFHDMSNDEVMAHTGLSSESAELARQREFTEPLLWHDSETALASFASELAAVNLQLQKGGRFYHVMGVADKGKAMLWLVDQYRQLYQDDITVVALGDGGNDVGMLRQADIGVVIRSPAHQPPTVPTGPGREVWLSEGFGPEGWAKSINQVLSQYPPSNPRPAA